MEFGLAEGQQVFGAGLQLDLHQGRLSRALRLTLGARSGRVTKNP